MVKPPSFMPTTPGDLALFLRQNPVGFFLTVPFAMKRISEGRSSGFTAKGLQYTALWAVPGALANALGWMMSKGDFRYASGIRSFSTAAFVAAPYVGLPVVAATGGYVQIKYGDRSPSHYSGQPSIGHGGEWLLGYSY